MLLFMPKYHGYKILVGLRWNIFPPLLLTSYRSLLTTHMIALHVLASSATSIRFKTHGPTFDVDVCICSGVNFD